MASRDPMNKDLTRIRARKLFTVPTPPRRTDDSVVVPALRLVLLVHHPHGANCRTTECAPSPSILASPVRRSTTPAAQQMTRLGAAWSAGGCAPGPWI